MMLSASASKSKIALVSCSTRHPRLNPFITDYVRSVLAESSGEVSIEIIDLAEQSLPLYNEPAVPSHLPATNPTPHYLHAHTREWSQIVRQYEAFIFVTPQYNWSIPASLKNALDYLYFEWKDKPAAIVSYGGRGGGKAACHLRDILTGLHMRPVATMPAVTTTVVMLEDCVHR
ncbi:hypothetical protein EV182_000415, partial [Spiromyces aspiralis]